MFAVIETGGKQIRVSEGDFIRTEKLAGKTGDKVVFDRVLLLGDGEKLKIGTPVVAKAKVTGEIVRQGKERKVIVYKFKRRKNYRRKHGHRQQFTEILVKELK
ncbi:MAG: 50S ribosomal protein L21 [Deltaproteobacteria bacterium]|nr:50S ribosomal protein L21 [Deltaproteobacteria bacterium]